MLALLIYLEGILSVAVIGYVIVREWRNKKHGTGKTSLA